MSTRKLGLVLLVAAATLSAAARPASARKLGLGRRASASEVARWDTFVAPEGKGLPQGQGSVATGQLLFVEKCMGCHGEHGEGIFWDGKSFDRLAGGQGTLASAAPVKTIGSYWPYATTLFNYIASTMPFMTPQTLPPGEVYALTAYLLHLNGILAADAVLDARRLPKVAMPNRNGFRSDPRPDIARQPAASAPPASSR